MPRFIPIATIATLLCATTPWSWARVFTSSNGSQLEAEVVSATDKEATLMTKDNRVITVTYEQLSEADRIFLRQRNGTSGMPAPVSLPASTMPATPPVSPPAAPAPILPNALKVSWTKDRLGSKLQPTDRDILLPGIHEDWMCHFQVNNTLRVPLENLKLTYEIYCAHPSSRGDSRSRIIKGSVQIPRLEGFRNARVDSDKMVMSASASPVYVVDSKGNTYKTGRNSLYVEEIEGVVITITQGSTLVHEYISPGLRDELAVSKP